MAIQLTRGNPEFSSRQHGHGDQKGAKANERRNGDGDRDGRQQLGLNGFNKERLARGLGWFSIGLGLAEVAMPRAIAKLVGVRSDHRMLIRTLGVREIASGIGILTQRKPAESVWSRVGGDAIDLLCLGAAFTSSTAKSGRVAAATAAVVGVTVLDVLCAQQLSRNGRSNGGVHHKKSITIHRPPEELYRYWHDLQNLPRFMKHLESVRVTGEGRSHWIAQAPGGMTVEWDAEITEDRPNELIAWRTLEGSDVDHSGSVRFKQAPGRRGTVMKVELHYNAPGGSLGTAIVTLFGEEPGQRIQDDMRRFKQVMETGEVMTTEGQPAGRASSTSWKYDQAVRG
ncbi:MAG TPA: SRPBCC family protein [Nitrospiraceae bacterium]|nr:SRPBCC family protein [Nitrospiraceae bacterium]